MPEQVEDVLIDRARIATRVAALGSEIARDVERDSAGGDGRPASDIVLIPILTGALVFVADLIRHMPLRLSLRVTAVSSYPGKTTSSRGVQVLGDLPTGLDGCHVIVVDDILDSGRTLAVVRESVERQRPASLRVAVLLRKVLSDGAGRPAGRPVEVPVEYVGFDIGNEFVVGYGLDYDGLYRNLPDIHTLRLSGPVPAGGRAP